jgi:hypothetical protein
LETSSGNVKTANNTHFEGGTQEPDEYLSTVITAEIDLEQQVDLFTETVHSACCKPFRTLPQERRTSRNVSHFGRTASL